MAGPGLRPNRRGTCVPTYSNLLPGDPAPTFIQRSITNPRYVFDTAAGRYLVLLFLGSASDPHSAAAVDALRARGDLFDDRRASFFGVTMDQEDLPAGRIADSYPGCRFILDYDARVSRLYGAAPREQEEDGRLPYRRFWAVIDPTMRMLRTIGVQEDRSDIAAVIDYLATLPPPSQHAGFELQAPIIVLPNVFEPDICKRLIDLYDAQGGKPSGFMREVDGRTVEVTDPAHKRRRDTEITDRDLIATLQGRFRRRVVPEIAKVHQFHATRMERHIVACYTAEDAGHFRAHRDNTTSGTAHRRFAVSVNLNDGFDGGEVSFPEYGTRGFRPPPGGALVFSCSLLHAVSPVTAGRRLAFLPFLYDEAAAKQREANSPFVGDGSGTYRA